MESLRHLEDDEYVYRLVGVNIHRGVADGGHYWSLINTKRGKDEPDPSKNLGEWQQSNQSGWKEFNDDQVSHYTLSNLEKDAYGGADNMTGFEAEVASMQQGAYGKSAYMLIYEKKLKRKIREVVLPAE